MRIRLCRSGNDRIAIPGIYKKWITSYSPRTGHATLRRWGIGGGSVDAPDGGNGQAADFGSGIDSAGARGEFPAARGGPRRTVRPGDRGGGKGPRAAGRPHAVAGGGRGGGDRAECVRAGFVRGERRA